MEVRRTRPMWKGRATSRATRAAAAAVPLLLLAPLAACDVNAVGKVSADERPHPARETPTRAADPEPTLSVAPPTPPAPPVPPTPGSADGSKKLEGGGFADAVPDTDKPDRKVDVGPQYQVSEDLDIREVERLVKAVEQIAKRQQMGAPMATGGSVAAAVGTFSYRWFADGSVQPDPQWVSEYIRTEQVPILGNVTGNKAMFPQLRGALHEVEARGLADQIHPSEYGGCYVPRFIGSDPSQGLSLHTWGIAVDLNVPGNQRGTAGEINRDVVAIFQKWGFAWGGDWRWTDPMHFELAQIVRPR